jgi:hypothetical protein
MVTSGPPAIRKSVSCAKRKAEAPFASSTLASRGTLPAVQELPRHAYCTTGAKETASRGLSPPLPSDAIGKSFSVERTKDR